MPISSLVLTSSFSLSLIPPLSSPPKLQVKEVVGNVATVTASDGAEVRVTLSPQLGSALDAPVVEFVAIVRGADAVEEVARAPLAGAFGAFLSGSMTESTIPFCCSLRRQRERPSVLWKRGRGAREFLHFARRSC